MMSQTRTFGATRKRFRTAPQPGNERRMFKLYFRLVSLRSLSVAIILSSLIIQQYQTVAFTPHDPCSACTNSLPFHRSKSLLTALSGAGGAGENPNEDDNDGDQNDVDFYRDLRRAKQQKLGRSIPPEQARESAVQAESDFLSAMRKTKDEFQKAKSELGSDGAIDLFLDKIREEDERNDEEC